MNMYQKDFKFFATSYEEIIVGQNRKSGTLDIIIKGDIISDEAIHISLHGSTTLQIAPFFVLPILGPYIGGDILPDRIMYGRLPKYEDDSRPLIPVVCEIFNNLTTIRFALQSPLRIIEFHGHFVD